MYKGHKAIDGREYALTDNFDIFSIFSKLKRLKKKIWSQFLINLGLR